LLSAQSRIDWFPLRRRRQIRTTKLAKVSRYLIEHELVVSTSA
jgi:hypothetical protein